MQFVYKDPNLGVRLRVAAIAGGRLLKRGVEYRLWVNPLDGGKAYVCDLQGVFLGVAKVLENVRADASPEELSAQLGLRQKVLSAEAKRLAPIARKRQAAAIDRATANLAALGLEDPVEADAAHNAADTVLRGDELPESDRDMLPPVESLDNGDAADTADYL
jgi:hypothetical protein